MVGGHGHAPRLTSNGAPEEWAQVCCRFYDNSSVHPSRRGRLTLYTGVLYYQPPNHVIVLVLSPPRAC